MAANRLARALGPFRNVIKKRALPLTGQCALTLFLMDDNKLAERRPISSQERRTAGEEDAASLSTLRGGAAAGFQRTNKQFSDPSILPPSLSPSPLACPLHEDCKLLPLRRRRPSIAYRTAREKQASGGGGGNRQLSKTNLVCCRRRRVRTQHT